MGLNWEKGVVMGMLAVFSIILGFLPYIIIRATRNSRFIKADSTGYKLVLTVLSCFGAGVLLSTATLHLLPEVRETLQEIPSVWETFDEHFPLAELFVLAGFALIYLVEEVAHFIMVDGHAGHHHHDPNSIARHNSVAHGIHFPQDSCVGNEGNDSSLQIPHPHHHGHTHSRNHSRNNSQTHHDEEMPKICALEVSEKESCPDEKNTVGSSLRSILTLIALSFHELMEGLAIGIQNESDMWVMFGAVASHKFVISFCMGMELMNSQASFRTFVGSICFFGLVTSVGIGIGGLITTASTNTLPVAVIEGLVVGTLLYVVCFEILSRERDRKMYSMKSSRAVGFIQFLSLGIGMIAMGMLATMMPHEHGEEDHAHDEGGVDDGHDHDHDHDHILDLGSYNVTSYIV